MKEFGGIGKITPLQLLNEGRTWLAIWNNASKEAETLLPATYCLFTAFEFHMKAYLIFKNSEYADIEKLKGCGHRFGTIYEKIIFSEKNSLTDEINIRIEEYELKDIKLDKLKYPENGVVWSLNCGLEKGEHALDNIFKEIDSEITSNFDQWLITTYPKQTEISVMIQSGYEGDPENIDPEILSNTCSECLPRNLVISENYNYYWKEEQIPPRICLSCKNSFNPNGMRPSL
ncbi:MAG: hypothetical protein WAW11_04040 [Patescibacteria group bacterium]